MIQILYNIGIGFSTVVIVISTLFFLSVIFTIIVDVIKSIFEKSNVAGIIGVLAIPVLIVVSYLIGSLINGA
jgi:hypothetical protein